MTSHDITLLLRLLIAHLVTDFVAQPDSWVAGRQRNGWRSPHLYLHGLVAGGVAYLFAGSWAAIWLLFLVLVAHIVIDGFTSRLQAGGAVFAADQALHLLVLAIGWAILTGRQVYGLVDMLRALGGNPRFLITAAAYLAVYWPAGILIGRMTAPLRQQLPEGPGGKTTAVGDEGLVRAGLWVGRLERLLIVTFVLLGRFEAIGFLIAAKSIFRFGDINTAGRRKEAEYILVGTLLSFVIGIAVGLLARWLIDATTVTAATLGQP